MQISCPKCSTSYMLDDRLLPPGGAPVQCTRCGHVFTAAPPASAAQTAQRSTQMFGLGPPPPSPTAPTAPSMPAAAPPHNATQVFGAVPSVAPVTAQKPNNATQVFGAVPSGLPSTVGVPVKPNNATQVFGAVPQVPAPATQPSKNATQVFGAIPGRAPDTAQSPGRATQVFGSIPSSPAAPQANGAPAPQANGAPAPSKNVTQVFGTVGAPAPGSMPRPSFSVERISIPEAQRVTLPGPAIDAPPAETGEPALGDLGGVSAREEPRFSGTASSPDLRVELPPEQSLPGPLDLGLERTPNTPAEDDEEIERMMRQQIRRRPTWILWLLVFAALGAAASYGYKQLQLRKNAVPPAVVSGVENAFELLRRDDAKAREQAEGQLEKLMRENPTYLDARAAYLVALMLDFDDRRVVIQHLSNLSKQEAAEINRLQTEQKPEDWQSRADGLRAQMQKVAGHMDALVDAATHVDGRIIDVAKGLPPPALDEGPSAIAVARARALLAAVKGTPDPMPLIEHYRSSGAHDAWGSVLFAEYAANQRLPPEETDRAIAMMETLRKDDNAYIRPYVLEARLAEVRKDREQAVSSLEAALALNPSHELAKLMLGWQKNPDSDSSAAP